MKAAVCSKRNRTVKPPRNRAKLRTLTYFPAIRHANNPEPWAEQSYGATAPSHCSRLIPA